MGKVNVLIIGADGFLGSSFISNVDKNKYNTIVGIDKKIANIEHNKIVLYNIDINNEPNLRHIVKKHNISTVIYLADNSIVDMCTDIDTKLFKVLSFLVEENIKLIYLSSYMVYDIREDQEYIESSKTSPSNLYGLNKIINENTILYYHQKYQLKYIILRPTNIYGKKDTNNRLVPNIIKSIKNPKETQFILKINNAIDLIYIEDIIVLLDLFSRESSFDNSVYNVSTGTNTLISDILLQIQDINQKFKYTIENKKAIPLSKINNQKVFSILSSYGLQLTNLQEGLKKVISDL
jgi:nucleoside-diphosphate-sugar epimerase